MSTTHSSTRGSRHVVRRPNHHITDGVQPGLKDHHGLSKRNFAAKPLTPAELKRAHKKTKPRWRRWFKRIIIILMILVIVGITGTVAVFAYYAKDLPSANQFQNAVFSESTKIYDRTGQHLLFETGKNGRRTYVPINDISANVINATVALEDKTFYTNWGFDPLGILRSIGIDLIHNRSIGGSSITQQLVKPTISNGEKTYARKIKELILAIETTRKYPKNQILEYYLNQNSYGGVNLGIEAAAQSYFGKSAKDVDLAQAATLAAIPQLPTYYTDPDNHTALKSRRNYALDLMVKQDFITQTQADEAKKEETTLKKSIVHEQAPHFVEYVKKQLEQDYGSIEDQGLEVITTLDYDKQKIAEDVITKGMVKVQQYGGDNAALVSIDAKTGQVLAMVGSKDYYDQNFDGQFNAATSLVQPGSSFKPLVYVTAFANGYNPNSVIFDVDTVFPKQDNGKDYHPYNYDMHNHGPLPMRNTLAMSLNVPAVKTIYLVGKDKVLDTADALGYTSLKDRSQYGLSLALGSGGVSLLQHTSAYATFAQGGMRHTISTILSIKDRKGASIFQWSNTQNQVLDKTAVAYLDNVLSTPSNRNSMFAILNIPGRTLAAKTGTTNNFRNALAMGFTPSYATGIWTGNNDNSSMHNGADGSIVAAPMMISYMKQILGNSPNESFVTPPPIKTTKPILAGQASIAVQKYVDITTGKIIPDNCVAMYPAQYKQLKPFKEVHDTLYYINKTNPLGPAPTNPASDPMFAPWESAVQQWAAQADQQTAGYLSLDASGNPTNLMPDCNAHSKAQTPTVTITSPNNSGSVTKQDFPIAATLTAGTGRNLKQVDYYIDAIRVDSKTKAPFTSTYTPNTLTTGSHIITVKATNDNGNVGQDQIGITFSTGKTNSNTNTTPSNTNSTSGFF